MCVRYPRWFLLLAEASEDSQHVCCVRGCDELKRANQHQELEQREPIPMSQHSAQINNVLAGTSSCTNACDVSLEHLTLGFRRST